MKLHENPKDFLAAIQATNQATGIREVFIEKDYWVCYVLKNLSESSFHDQVIFKGGTSLSKAHKVIHRFSEDVDLAILNNSEPDAQIKKLIKAIEQAIAKNPLRSIEKKGLTSKHGRFRKTVWEYDKTSEGDYGDASPDLLLEINSFATPSPFQLVEIQTYIAEHLIQQKQKDTIAEFGLESFKVNVLDIRRTFAEKVSAVSRASFESDDSHDQLKKKIRHLYDLAMLLRNQDIKKFLANGDFKKLYVQVYQDDLKLSGSESSQMTKDFKEAPVFKNSKQVIEQLRSAYEGQFATLVYRQQDMPNIAELIKAIQSIALNGAE